MLKRILLPCVCAGLCLVGIAAAPGASAGDITGVISFEGKAPKMRPLPLETNPDCKPLTTEKSLTEILLVSEAGELANVLVYVVGGLPEADYPVPEEEFVITQQGCVYAPHVFGVRAGQTIRIKNPDGINHNVHMLPEVNRPLNKTMNAQRRETTHKFREPEPPFSIKCDIHSWMQAYCAVFDHPFFAVSAKDGTYAIKDLPPGKYQLEAWHEHRRLGVQRIDVEVAAGGVTTANFIFSPANPN